jgi:hypothetical protein
MSGVAMMVIAMRWTAFLLLSVLAGAAEIGGSSVRTIYILPMGHGLDQYVANRLTREHLLDVVADAARADAILTDTLGKPLEVELEKLHPTPKPQEHDADSDGDSEDSDTPQKSRTRRTFTNSETPISTFARGKGTMFLVDAHSRAVLWSVYERPVKSTPDELDHTAKRVVERLKRDLAPKPSSVSH